MVSANEIIDFLCKAEYRLLSLREINSFLKENAENDQLKKLLFNIFSSKYPVYSVIKPKDLLNNPNVDNPVRWFEAVDTPLLDDKNVSSRMDSVIEGCDYKKLFSNVEISFQEAAFYLHLFQGSKFGLSAEILNKYLKFKLPLKTLPTGYLKEEDLNILEDFPYIVENSIPGIKLKACVHNNSFKVFDTNHKEYTHKFKILNKVLPFLPSDKKIIIKFVLSPRETDSWAVTKLNTCLNSDSGLSELKPYIVIYDMFPVNNNKSLIKRLKRIDSFVKKCSIKSILSISYSKVKTSPELKKLCGTLLKKYNSLFIKNNNEQFKVVGEKSRISGIINDYEVSTVYSPRVSKVAVTTACGTKLIIDGISNYLEPQIPNKVGELVQICYENNMPKIEKFL